MEHISLKYGTSTIEFNIEGAKSVNYLLENEMPIIKDVKSEFIRCVADGAINSKPLNKLLKKDDKVTIVISDLTRFWSRQDILCQLLVEYLHDELKIPFENIIVLIALGSHRGNTEEEKEKLASKYVYSKVKVIDHNCLADDLVYIGTTSYGTKVSVNSLAVGRKVICIGATVHHIMAGYGGGRKSIVPGLASSETIRMNHERALDPEKAMSDPRVGSGKMSQNPIHLDMFEAGKLVDVVFGINIVVGNSGKHSAFFCGDFDSAWKESCRFVQNSYGLPIEKEADIVIASCGGFPKDINLYQSVKTLFNATQAVKKGGTLVMLAQCVEGGGAKDFFDWNEPLKEGRLDEVLRKNFTIGGYIFYATCESLDKAQTYLISDIDPEHVKDMGFIADNNSKKIFENINFENKDIYIIPYGGSVMPQLKEDYKKLSDDI